MNVARPLSMLSALVMMASATAAQGESKPVIELFTSQGCSSCPPADEVLGRLAANPKLIPLTLSVDYWDYLGWRDTLALNAHTLRQKAYARARGDMNVYTPQAVVNGSIQLIGADRSGIDAALRNHPSNEQEVPLQLRRNGDSISVDIGAGQGKATVWLLTVTKKVQVKIARGENRGATVTYSNVVRSWRNLGAYSGAPMKASIPVSELTGNDADSVVVLVQSGSENSPGPIRSADIVCAALKIAAMVKKKGRSRGPFKFGIEP